MNPLNAALSIRLPSPNPKLFYLLQIDFFLLPKLLLVSQTTWDPLISLQAVKKSQTLSYFSNRKFNHRKTINPTVPTCPIGRCCEIRSGPHSPTLKVVFSSFTTNASNFLHRWDCLNFLKSPISTSKFFIGQHCPVLFDHDSSKSSVIKAYNKGIIVFW